MTLKLNDTQHNDNHHNQCDTMRFMLCVEFILCAGGGAVFRVSLSLMSLSWMSWRHRLEGQVLRPLEVKVSGSNPCPFTCNCVNPKKLSKRLRKLHRKSFNSTRPMVIYTNNDVVKSIHKKLFWVQHYKTCFVRNLLIFVISYSVCWTMLEKLIKGKHWSLLRKLWITDVKSFI